MAQRIEIIKVPNPSTERNLVGIVNQFFAQNPAITIQDISLLFNEREGRQLYQLIIVYESNGGATYEAAQFESVAGGSSADFLLEQYYLDNDDLHPIRVFDITSQETSTFTGLQRYFVIAVDTKTAYRLHASGLSIPSQAAQDIASGATDLFKQTNGWIPASSDQFDARNAGGGTWVSQAEGIIALDEGGSGGGISCCGVSGTDDTGAAVAPPTGQVCDGSGPPGSPPPPPPPPVGNCCLRYTHECQCLGGVDTWVLLTVSCLNNALCNPFQSTCDGQNASFEQQDACFCGAALPAFVPDPACDPDCCAPPPLVNCCLNAVFDCDCSSDEPEWVQTTLECIANGMCGDGTILLKQDLDGDGNIDHVEYSEQEGCLCGTTDIPTLEALLPAPDFVNGEPVDDPDCCTGTCCLELKYYCVEYYGMSKWEFLESNCILNNDCTSSGTSPEEPVRDCNPSEATITLRDGCDCSDLGSVEPETAEEALPDEPEDCIPTCTDKNCAYRWRSTYSCVLSAWGAPTLLQTTCEVSPSSTPWAYTTGCNAERITVGDECSTWQGCATPAIIAGPALAAPAGCCSSPFIMGDNATLEGWVSTDGISFVDMTTPAADMQGFLALSASVILLQDTSSVLESTDGGNTWGASVYSVDGGAHNLGTVYARSGYDASTDVMCFCPSVPNEFGRGPSNSSASQNYLRKPNGSNVFFQLTLAATLKISDIKSDGDGIWVAVGLDQGSGGGGEDEPVILRSTDDATTFAVVERFNPGGMDTTLVQLFSQVAYGQSGGVDTWIAVGSYFPTVGSSTQPVVMRSTDNGVNWSDISADILSADPTPDTNQGALCVATDGAGTWIILVRVSTTGNAYIARSIDNGVNWSGIDLNEVENIFPFQTHAAYDENTGTFRVHWGDDSSSVGNQSRYYSTDGGLTWTRDTSETVPATATINFISQDVLPH